MFYTIYQRNACMLDNSFQFESKVVPMERRKDSRIKISGNSFVTRKHSEKKIGRIIDISGGGLAFHYLNSASIPGNFSFEIGIWFQEKKLFMPNIRANIRANTVSDIQVAYENPFMQIPLRRRSVQFCGLSLDQNQQLHSACGPIRPDNPQVQQ